MYKQLLLLLLVTTIGKAQNGIIKGLVKDDKNEAVVGATVILSKSQKGAIVKSSFTDAAGKFEFEKLKYDTLEITVSFVGMSKYASDRIVLTEQNLTVDLGAINLKNGENELNEVAVKAQRAFVVQKIDRTVINPDALISNAGVTSLEVLEKSPGVTVDINGNISLRGKGGG